MEFWGAIHLCLYNYVQYFMRANKKEQYLDLVKVHIIV
jgi:hypothetical protein